jgi:uncharacterized SAM-binding protein YcdF (DUF218 family)
VRAIARGLGGAFLLLLVLVGFTPLAERLQGGMPAAAALAPADAIVVLGSGVMPEGELTDNSLRRTVHGIRLFRQGLAPRIVLLGPAYHGAVEAEVRAGYAHSLGVPADAIVVEPEGLSTRDEARLVHARLGGPRGASVILVTGLHHMPRARAAFEREGLTVAPAPVLEDSLRPQRPQARLALARAVVQEAIARAYYRMAGAS